MNKYINVVVGLPVEGPFTYRVPKRFRQVIAVGKRVWIPFGRMKQIGYVVEVSDKSSISDKGLKYIKDVIDDEPIVNKELLKLTKKISEYYYNSWGESIEAVIPPGLKKGRVKLTPRKKAEKIVSDEDFKEDLKLTRVQKKAFDCINKKIKSSKYGAFLLHGITASGKTEVYLQAIREVRKKGKSCIVLVPEISLTPQASERFTARFGEQVAVLHSKMLNSHRFKEWKRIKDGQASIVIGPRSAIFAPVKKLGLIIIDEEQETTYKQNDVPRYDVRKVAEMRAGINDAALVLGSATPSLESYYKAETGEYELLHLPERVTKKDLPEVQIVDMKEEIGKQRKRNPVLSIVLKDKLKKVIKNKQQAILFLNRKGFATYVHCIKCGYEERCKRCNISLTYHSGKRKLVCHYCNFQKDVPDVCPECDRSYIRKHGKGTEKVVSEINKTFPGVNIIRMDTEATVKRGSHKKILDKFKERKYDILVGTQMIAKGLDFPKVTLVGVISADTALNLPDFRAAERTFSLLTQVAGRAGRGDEGGKVVIQTYNPDHFSIIASRKHNYKKFYKNEIDARKQLSFPPFSHLANIVLRGTKEEKVEKTADKICKLLKENINRSIEMEILGPAPAPVSKIKGKYRYNIILNSKNVSDIIKVINKAIGNKRRFNKVYVKIDIDPQRIL